MLRRFDCNWIDETGTPIPLQYLQKRTAEAHALERRIVALQQELAGAREHADSCRRRSEACRREYESMGVVRLHHRVHRALERAPAIVRRPTLAALRVLKRLTVGRPA